MILNILKRIYKILCVVCSEIPFREDSCRIKTSQIDLQFRIKRLFTEKCRSRLLYAVLNIVNNGKYLFFTIYCMYQWIEGETLIFWVNVKITRFLLLINWVWVGFDQLHLYLYIYVSLEFLLPTLNKFTIKYNTIQSAYSDWALNLRNLRDLKEL